ncbi:hypothetical protein [Sneathiella sp.]|uniref:hypothetical protein n=1 Tax=Sneathiella sp. TaxID=1964365 RepID=UPI00263721AC|nr:hypothetical protein [Sneathiella sp.]MDF2366454.1 hypothetical protein [Sneathiella sp.]
MKYSFIAASILLFTLPAIATARDGTATAAANWNDSTHFQTSYDILTKSAIAELIEKKEGGFYDGWNQYNSYITNIGAQTTTIGSQTVFTDSNLDNVFVTPVNCGEIVSSTSVDSPATNEDSTNISSTIGAPCQVQVNNASNP